MGRSQRQWVLMRCATQQFSGGAGTRAELGRAPNTEEAQSHTGDTVGVGAFAAPSVKRFLYHFRSHLKCQNWGRESNLGFYPPSLCLQLLGGLAGPCPSLGLIFPPEQRRVLSSKHLEHLHLYPPKCCPSSSNQQVRMGPMVAWHSIWHLALSSQWPCGL